MALPDDSTPSAPMTHDVTVRRSPRIVRFMLVGVVVAIVITLVLTFSFPETPNYSRAQVFGFVGIILVTVFVGLASLVAVLVDRSSTRLARTVTMSSERIAARREADDEADQPQD